MRCRGAHAPVRARRPGRQAARPPRGREILRQPPRDREIPDHPLVEQTLDDCLHEAMDCNGWLALLRRMEQGGLRLISRDLPAPSPLAAEILNARPYTFLDDAPLEERRTQAVLNRRWSDPQSTDDLGALDPQAIESVREEAWPHPGSVDEMHEALMSLGAITDREALEDGLWLPWLRELAEQHLIFD